MSFDQNSNQLINERRSTTSSSQQKELFSNFFKERRKIAEENKSDSRRVQPTVSQEANTNKQTLVGQSTKVTHDLQTNQQIIAEQNRIIEEQLKYMEKLAALLEEAKKRHPQQNTPQSAGIQLLPSDNKQLVELFITLDDIEEVAIVAREMAQRLENCHDIAALQKIFVTHASVSHVLLNLKLAKSETSVAALAFAVENFSYENDELIQKLSEVHLSNVQTFLLRGLAIARTDDCIIHVCSAIANLAQHDAGAKLFSTPEFRDAIVACSKHAITAQSAENLCFAISNICRNNSEGQKLFSTPEVRDAIIACYKTANTADVAVNVCVAIANICDNNPEGKKLCSTAEVQDAITKSFEVICNKTNSSKTEFIKATEPIGWSPQTANVSQDSSRSSPVDNRAMSTASLYSYDEENDTMIKKSHPGFVQVLRA